MAVRTNPVRAGQRTGPATGRDRPRRRPRSISRTLTPYLFLVVPLTFLVVFTYIPVVNMFWYSVTSWDGLSPSKEFVGFDNYIEIVSRPELFGVLKVSLYYIGASVAQIFLALYFATVLSFNTRFRNL